MASKEGYDPQTLEKVLHLMNLPSTINAHRYLKGKWLLKGGTVLNLLMLDLHRLSVDIDLNYIGALDCEEMLEQRPKVEQAAQPVFSREGFRTKSPSFRKPCDAA